MYQVQLDSCARKHDGTKARARAAGNEEMEETQTEYGRMIEIAAGSDRLRTRSFVRCHSFRRGFV